MQESITIAEVGSIVKVSGSRIATPFGPPRPGSTPTKMPSTSPTIISAIVFQVRRTTNPCSSRPKASINSFHLAVVIARSACDEAIQSYFMASGLLPRDGAPRNDGESHSGVLIPERRFEWPLRHDHVEHDIEGHEHQRAENEGGQQRLP